MTAALTYCRDTILGGGGLPSPPVPTTTTATWQKSSVTWLGGAQPIWAIASNPDGSVMLCGTGNNAGTILRSTDQGNTWTERAVPGAPGIIYGVAYGGGKFLALGLGPRSSVSTDGGLTWSAFGAAPPSANDDYLAWYGNGVWVSMASGSFGVPPFHRSVDGQNWTAVNPGFGNDGAFGQQSVTWDGTQFCYAGNNSLELSSDGLNWTQEPAYHAVGSVAFIDYANGLYAVASETGYGVVIADTAQGLVTGANVAPTGLASYPQCIMVLPSGRVLLWVEDGDTYSTIDKGATWQKENNLFGAMGAAQAAIAKIGNKALVSWYLEAEPVYRIANCGG